MGIFCAMCKQCIPPPMWHTEHEIKVYTYLFLPSLHEVHSSLHSYCSLRSYTWHILSHHMIGWRLTQRFDTCSGNFLLLLLYLLLLSYYDYHLSSASDQFCVYTKCIPMVNHIHALHNVIPKCILMLSKNNAANRSAQSNARTAQWHYTYWQYGRSSLVP